MKRIVKKFLSVMLSIVIGVGLIGIMPGREINASAATFTPRTTAPSTSDARYYSSNKFYISGYGMPNCTAYAYGRAWEILGSKPNLPNGNAGSWYSQVKASGAYPCGSTPKLGAIACWDKYDNNKGHVAVVEAINGSNITISESHYKGVNFDTKTIAANSSNYLTSMRFLGYIYIGDFSGSSYNSNPTGHNDEIVASNGNLYFRGWAYDPDNSSQSIEVHVYAGSKCIYVGTTDDARSDVNTAFNISGTHGYKKTISTGLSGTQNVKIYAINVGGGSNYVIWEGSLNFGATEQICDLGKDFNAIISKGGKVVTASYDDKVKMYSKTANADMIAKKYTWHFIKNSDGSYGIWSYHGGKALEIVNSSDTDGAAVKVVSSYTGKSNQRWFIIKNSNGTYSLRPGCSKTRVLDVTGNSTAEGTLLELFTKNTTGAQYFSISNLSADSKPPAISKVTIGSITNDSFKMTINATDNNGVKDVKVIASSWKLTENKEFKATQKNYNTWECTLKSSDFGGEHGEFFASVFVSDYNDNVAFKEGYSAKVGVYTLTFDAKGGNAVSPKTKTIVYGHAYNRGSALPKPTRTGYTFNGWYTAKTGGTKITDSTKVTAKSNHTIYAQWKANTYKRTLDPQGGTCDKASITATFGQKVGALPTPTRTGYTFLGWYSAKAGGTKVTADSVITTAANSTIYAQWKANTYKRTLDPQGGTCDKASITVTFGQKVGALPTPTKTGYTFLGWYNATTGGTKVTADNVVGVACDGTLHAQWQVNTYIRTLDPQGGTCDKASITATFGQKVGTLPTPTRTGYTFLGWYSAKTGGVKITADSVITTAADSTIYAQWQANTYIRTLDLQGGKCDTDQLTVTFGQTIGELPNPTKEGYIFAGWYTDETYGELVTSDYIIKDAQDGTIYAYWTEDILLGDVYADGSLSLLDVIYFQRYIIGIRQFDEAQLRRADMNGDGRINVFDLMLLKKAIAT